MTAFDNDRWEAERKARLERVGHREADMTKDFRSVVLWIEEAIRGRAPEMTPLEKAARAASDADMTWAFNPDGDRFEHIARAVLMAVREPDASMKRASDKASGDALGLSWMAVIDAILETQP